MVDMKVTLSPSNQMMRDRRERLDKMTTVPGIRVEPRDADMRRLLRHPKAGKFRSEGSLEWPNDTFTQKRLRDGDIKLEEDSHAGAAANPATAGSRPADPLARTK